MSKQQSKGKSGSSRPGRSAKGLGRLDTEDMIFQPWFLTRRTAIKIRWLIPPDYRKRMHDYFDDNGCMRCDSPDGPYKSNGMCARCAKTIWTRLRQSVHRRLKGKPSHRYGRKFLEEERKARKLLREFVPADRAARGMNRRGNSRLNNPVCETPVRLRE